MGGQQNVNVCYRLCRGIDYVSIHAWNEYTRGIYLCQILTTGDIFPLIIQPTFIYKAYFTGQKKPYFVDIS